MSSQKTSQASKLADAQALAPDIQFVSGTSFQWSPQMHTITYVPDSLKTTSGNWSLLHETAHALLQHTIYKTDFELLLLEVAAWEEAKRLATDMGIQIDEEHIQDCLDTYRNWLHQRSTCPTCGTRSLQHSQTEYRCHNCLSSWTVSSSRFCRAYRRKRTAAKEKSPDSVKNQTTFG